MDDTPSTLDHRVDFTSEAARTVMTTGQRHADFVSHIRAQVARYAGTRSYTYLGEVGRELTEDVVTFDELDRDARAIAAWLATRPERDRPVLLLYPDGIDFLRAFLGCLYAGAIAVPAPLPHDGRSMQRTVGMFDDADIRPGAHHGGFPCTAHCLGR